MLFENGAILSHTSAGVLIAVWRCCWSVLLIGLINGLAIAYARIPAFMVTLVTQMFFAALAIYYVKSENIIDLPDGFTRIGDDTAG